MMSIHENQSYNPSFFRVIPFPPHQANQSSNYFLYCREDGETATAEGAGFEPARPFGPAVFKTAAFNHSATSPGAST